jgi:hypothetical protein
MNFIAEDYIQDHSYHPGNEYHGSSPNSVYSPLPSVSESGGKSNEYLSAEDKRNRRLIRNREAARR